VSTITPPVLAPATLPTLPRWVRPLTGLLSLVLALQFTIGMVVNFWVKLPDAHPGTNAANYFVGVAQGDTWALFTSDWALKLHVLIGLLVFLAAILLLVAAIARRERLWIWVASLGLVGIIAAGFNGASYLNYGHDFSSLLMSIGFVLALCSYMVGLYFSRPDAR
jgi:hypothetical protein